MNTMINFKKTFLYVFFLNASIMNVYAMIVKQPILPEDVDKMDPAAALWTEDQKKTAYCWDVSPKKYTLEVLDLNTLEKVIIPHNYEGEKFGVLTNRYIALSPKGKCIAYLVSYYGSDDVKNELVMTSLDTFEHVKFMLPTLDNNQIPLDDYRVAFDASTLDIPYIFESNKKRAYTIINNHLQEVPYQDLQTKKFYVHSAHLLDFSDICQRLTQRLKDKYRRAPSLSLHGNNPSMNIRNQVVPGVGCISELRGNNNQIECVALQKEDVHTSMQPNSGNQDTQQGQMSNPDITADPAFYQTKIGKIALWSFGIGTIAIIAGTVCGYMYKKIKASKKRKINKKQSAQ